MIFYVLNIIQGSITQNDTITYFGQTNVHYFSPEIKCKKTQGSGLCKFNNLLIVDNNFVTKIMKSHFTYFTNYGLIKNSHSQVKWEVPKLKIKKILTKLSKNLNSNAKFRK